MLYIGNTFFEWELEGKIKGSLADALQCTPVCQQLQYLPLLFLEPKDTLLVTELPQSEYLNHLRSYIKDLPQVALLEEDLKGEVKSWGASNIVRGWAEQKGLSYSIPSLDIVRRVNSKLWNFTRTTPLEGAAIIQNEEELKKQLQGLSGNWVLKTDQGFAGLGHCIFNENQIEKAVQFGKKIWRRGDRILLEPWVERILDFSSQWEISVQGEIVCLGVTKFFNNPLGGYLGTVVGQRDQLFGPLDIFVVEHLRFCEKYLFGLFKEGYYGCLGIDAMVYKCPERHTPRLHPILEVNARMTMSSAVLRFWKKWEYLRTAFFTFKEVSSPTLGLLPNGFKRQLIIDSK